MLPVTPLSKVTLLPVLSTAVMRSPVMPDLGVPSALTMSTTMPSVRLRVSSTVKVLVAEAVAAERVASLPLPSPKSILPKLNLDAFKSPSISALSRLTKAPSVEREARIALSEISILP